MKFKNILLSAITIGCFCVVFVAGSNVDLQNNSNNKSSNAKKTQEPENVEIVINNFNFTPKTLTIKAGTTVVWNNKEGAHTVKADNNSWESPTLTAGQTFSRKFTRAGKYPYYCTFHGDTGGHKMAGLIIVKK